MILTRCKIALLLTAMLFSFGCNSIVKNNLKSHGKGSRITIAKAGKAKAVIVVAVDANEPETHAAKELGAFLRQITGAEFRIYHDRVDGRGNIFVGPKAAKLADENFSTDGLEKEGIVIRTVGGDLILAGGYPRGTLYAVYTFLEDNLGCRWWSSKVSTIPKKPTIKIGPLNVRYVPILR